MAIGWLGLDEILIHVWISCYFHSHVVKMNKQFDQTYFSDGKKNTSKILKASLSPHQQKQTTGGNQKKKNTIFSPSVESTEWPSYPPPAETSQGFVVSAHHGEFFQWPSRDQYAQVDPILPENWRTDLIEPSNMGSEKSFCLQKPG